MMVTVIRKSYGNIYLAAFIKNAKRCCDDCIVVRQMQLGCASPVQNTVYLCTQLDCGTEESFCCGCCSTNPRRVPVGLSTPRCDDDGVCVVHSRRNLIASSYRSNERASRAVRPSLFIGATKIPHRRGLGMASR